MVPAVVVATLCGCCCCCILVFILFARCRLPWGVIVRIRPGDRPDDFKPHPDQWISAHGIGPMGLLPGKLWPRDPEKQPEEDPRAVKQLDRGKAAEAEGGGGAARGGEEAKKAKKADGGLLAGGELASTESPRQPGAPEVKHGALKGTSALWRQRYAEATAAQQPLWERSPSSDPSEEEEEEATKTDVHTDARARLSHGEKLRHDLRQHPLRMLQAVLLWGKTGDVTRDEVWVLVKFMRHTVEEPDDEEPDRDDIPGMSRLHADRPAFRRTPTTSGLLMNREEQARRQSAMVLSAPIRLPRPSCTVLQAQQRAAPAGAPVRPGKRVSRRKAAVAAEKTDELVASAWRSAARLIQPIAKLGSRAHVRGEESQPGEKRETCVAELHASMTEKSRDAPRAKGASTTAAVAGGEPAAPATRLKRQGTALQRALGMVSGRQQRAKPSQQAEGTLARRPSLQEVTREVMRSSFVAEDAGGIAAAASGEKQKEETWKEGLGRSTRADSREELGLSFKGSKSIAGPVSERCAPRRPTVPVPLGQRPLNARASAINTEAIDADARPPVDRGDSWLQGLASAVGEGLQELPGWRGPAVQPAAAASAPAPAHPHEQLGRSLHGSKGIAGPISARCAPRRSAVPVSLGQRSLSARASMSNTEAIDAAQLPSGASGRTLAAAGWPLGPPAQQGSQQSGVQAEGSHRRPPASVDAAAVDRPKDSEQSFFL